MQAVRILAAEVHDGLGGVHHRDDVVALPDDVVQIFLARNLAVPADGKDVANAILRAKQAESERLADQLKSEAVSRMKAFDAMPPEVRERAREIGDDAVTEHLNILAREAETPKRGRGRPRKEKPSDD